MSDMIFINGGFYNVEYVTAWMDDTLTQEVADSVGDCHPLRFVKEYSKRHYELFGKEFTIEYHT